MKIECLGGIVGEPEIPANAPWWVARATDNWEFQFGLRDGSSIRFSTIACVSDDGEWVKVYPLEQGIRKGAPSTGPVSTALPYHRGIWVKASDVVWFMESES